MRTVASVDIGTSKIVALIGEVDSYGDVHIIGVGTARSKGIDKGSVTRLDVSAKAVASAVREAEEMSGQKIGSVIINVSGPKIKSQNEKVTIPISPAPIEVERSHIVRLIDNCLSKGKEEGYEIIHSIPRKYTLDDQEGIEDPVGLIGSKLTAQVHIVKSATTLSLNLSKAITASGLKPSYKVASPLASAKAVLREEEMEDGVLVLDIGAGLTDFVLYLDGYPALTGSIPLGGNNITKDLSHYMKVDQEEAERIKRENGVALVDAVKEGEMLKIKPRGEEREVSVERVKLAEVIQIRLEEIFEKIDEHIRNLGFKLDSANAGVVITGGTANLKGIKEFAERFTDLPARIGVPRELTGLKDKIEDPSYSTAVGLLRFATMEELLAKATASTNTNSNSKSKLNGFFDKFKEFLREIL